MEPDQPVRTTRLTRFLISKSGIGTELIDLFATTSDISALRNRAAAQGGAFIYCFGTMAIAGETTFGKPGEFDGMPIFVAFGLAYLLCIRMDAFVNLRGLYAQGKRQLRKMGLKLPYGADDVAWWLLLLSRCSVGIAVSIIAGTLSAQCFFQQEIQEELASQVAGQNAPLLAFHTKAVDADLKVARDIRDRNARELEELNTQRGTLLKQNTRLSTSVRGASTRQQANISAAREANSGTLGAIDTRVEAAETRASASDQAYKLREANRNADVRVRLRSDPHYTKPPSGLLASLTALEKTAAKDRVVAAGIGVIDFVGLALEAWILVLALASPPTRLAVNLYRDVLRHSAESARRLAAELKGPPDDVGPDPNGPPNSPFRGGAAAHAPLVPEPEVETPPVPLRRPRGRPRKHPLPAISAAQEKE
jgi:hypothetical protein